jgi:predicted Zn-dependent peptidase
VEKAIGAIAEELNLLRINGVTDDELSTAKEQLKGNHIFSLESVSGRMASLGRNKLLIGKNLSAQEIADKINGVTMDHIQAVSEKITAVDQYSGILIGRKKKDIKKLLQSS